MEIRRSAASAVWVSCDLFLEINFSRLIRSGPPFCGLFLELRNALRNGLFVAQMSGL